MARGVEILHVIPTPFPHVWHTIGDDASALDGVTMEDWGRILTGFVGEWMDLEGYFPEIGKEGKEKERRDKDEL